MPAEDKQTNAKQFLKFWGIKLLQFASAGVIFVAAQYAVLVGAMRLALIVCPVLGPICSKTNMSGIGIVLLVCVALSILCAAAFLRYVAEMRWLNSIAATVLGAVVFFTLSSSFSTVYQADMSVLNPPMWVTLPLCLVAAFVAHGLLFYRIKTWLAVLLGATLLTVYVVCFAALQLVLPDWHASYEEQKDLRETKNLSFVVYAPTYTPAGYNVFTSNAIKSYYNSPDSYSLTYSTKQTYSPDAENIYLGERRWISNSGSSLCTKGYGYVVPSRGTCTHIGNTTACDVYYQFPSSNGPDWAEAFCLVGTTRVDLEIKVTAVSKEEILKIFESMEPADIDAIHQKIPKKRY